LLISWDSQIVLPPCLHEKVSFLSSIFSSLLLHSDKDVDPFACAVVHMLNDLFSRFDLLVDKYDLNKVKTIGDCYMVVRMNLYINMGTV
jgi:hypothetical protein